MEAAAIGFQQINVNRCEMRQPVHLKSPIVDRIEKFQADKEPPVLFPSKSVLDPIAAPDNLSDSIGQESVKHLTRKQLEELNKKIQRKFNESALLAKKNAKLGGSNQTKLKTASNSRERSQPKQISSSIQVKVNIDLNLKPKKQTKLQNITAKETLSKVQAKKDESTKKLEQLEKFASYKSKDSSSKVF